MVKLYRNGYGLFASNGILFNHESPLRGIEFVSRKITNAVAKISLGLKKELILGNLKAKRDWGFAGDYVKAYHKILSYKKPEDFIISSGSIHKIKDFIKYVLQYGMGN